MILAHIDNRRILMQTECFLHSSLKACLNAILCTMSQKTCDYIFYNNLNNIKCPITIIFATFINQTIRHRKMVLFPTDY